MAAASPAAMAAASPAAMAGCERRVAASAAADLSLVECGRIDGRLDRSLTARPLVLGRGELRGRVWEGGGGEEISAGGEARRHDTRHESRGESGPAAGSRAVGCGAPLGAM